MNIVNNLWNILVNGWVVGTGTSILGGVIIAWLTNVLFKKTKTELLRLRVEAANNEILHAVRPFVPDGKLPDIDVVERIIHRTAKRKVLKADDLYRPEEIVDELVKEVMDSAFLSVSSKQELCTKLISSWQRFSTTDTETNTKSVALQVSSVSVSGKSSHADQSTKKLNLDEWLIPGIAGIFAAVGTGELVVHRFYTQLVPEFHAIRVFTISTAVLLLLVSALAAVAIPGVMRLIQTAIGRWRPRIGEDPRNRRIL
jgi:hypothetical protein